MAGRTADRFTTITVEGAILPPDLLKRIAENDKSVEGLTPDSYALVDEKLNEAISRSWNKVRGLWTGFRDAKEKLPPGDNGAKLTRERWLLPLFKELDYGLLAAARPEVIDEKIYAVSHGWEHTPVHIVGCGVDLDERVQASIDGPKMSSHGLVQEFLNRSKPHLWAFVSNGLRLRILRDSLALTRQAFVEFNLEAMMRDEVYPDFVLLWMLCHASRVKSDRPEDCWLEKWSRAAQEQGTRALDQLRDGVEKAIAGLGRGFLLHPANKELRLALESGQLTKEEYYRCLLRLVYRLIFLFVAEDRDLLLLPAASPEAKARFRRFYSTQHLREVAKAVKGTPHGDLWQSLSVVMGKLGQDEGCRELGLPALGSFLWSTKALGLVGAGHLSNRSVLDTIRDLTFTEDRKVRRYVDYRNLGAEELGSIYESLLELHPRLNVKEGLFDLSTASGSERKTTGSYYTPTSLVTCLLDSALDPVLADAAKKPEPEQALLALKVVDPACGSGHFLIAAAHRIAKSLAFVRTGNEEPSPIEIRKALRDVIGQCIYGVDLNEMAVELCKVSLWMEALEPGRPLSFLDSKIRHGNALIGATPELLKSGLPDDAFEAADGDDKAIVTALKKRNKAERSGQSDMFVGVSEPLLDLARTLVGVSELPDDSIAAVHRKEAAYAAIEASSEHKAACWHADSWCAAFVARKTEALGLTTDTLEKIRRTPSSLPKELLSQVEQLRPQFRFFHWHIFFPEVCGALTSGGRGGFDVVLGNPPWDSLRFSEEEFFAVRNPVIADASTAAKRKKLIGALAETDPPLYSQFLEERRRVEGENIFVRNSGRFPLCGIGRVNLFALFAEAMLSLVAPHGRVGAIVPSGIATDDSTKALFWHLIESGQLVSLFDFENREGLFESVHRNFKFSLLTAVGGRRKDALADFVFYAGNVTELSIPEKQIALSARDIEALNPLSKTSPTFRSRRDARITLDIQRRIPILAAGKWNLRLRRLINQSDDSDQFKSEPSPGLLPLYEGKYFHLYDHRWGTCDSSKDRDVTLGEKANPSFAVTPRHWFPASSVSERFGRLWKRPWVLAWRDITNASNERTMIVAILPSLAIPNTAKVFLPDEDMIALVPLLQGIMSSVVLDFVARQKIGWTHMATFTVEQLPVLPPASFDGVCPWERDTSLRQWIEERVLELDYTAEDLSAFAKDVGLGNRPFRWDEARRALLRAELDAAFFVLYGLDRSDTDYVLDTFPVLRRNEEAKFGEYRTKRLVLEQYDLLAMRRGAGTPSSNLGQVLPFKKVTPKPEEKYRSCLPLYSLKPAAGAFSDFQEAHAEAWVELRTRASVQKGRFVAQVVGKSMEPLIPDGAYCVFQRPWLKPKPGEVGLFRLNDAADPETGGRFTVKRLNTRRVVEDGEARLVGSLAPENPEFQPIVVESGEEDSVQAVAVLVHSLQPADL